MFNSYAFDYFRKYMNISDILSRTFWLENMEIAMLLNLSLNYRINFYAINCVCYTNDIIDYIILQLKKILI